MKLSGSSLLPTCACWILAFTTSSSSGVLAAAVSTLKDRRVEEPIVTTCETDTQTCKDGTTTVSRDPDNDCEFFPCSEAANESLSDSNDRNDEGGGISSAAFCGDGKMQGEEECDGSDLGGLNCTDLGFTGGVLQCTDGCSFSTMACTTCGDGVRDLGETCDNTDLPNGFDCATFGYIGGTLTCNDQCEFSFQQCHQCGDGMINGEEDCDLFDLNGKTCQDFGSRFAGGSLKCNDSCEFDTSECSTANPTATPSVSPSTSPSHTPSSSPSHMPSIHPSTMPSSIPSGSPSSMPSATPSMKPSSKKEEEATPDSAATTDDADNETTTDTNAIMMDTKDNLPATNMTREDGSMTVMVTTAQKMPMEKKMNLLWSEDFSRSGQRREDGGSDIVFQTNLFKGTSVSDKSGQMEGRQSSTKFGRWANGMATGGLRLRLMDAGKGEAGDVSAGWIVTLEVDQDIEDATIAFQYRVDVHTSTTNTLNNNDSNHHYDWHGEVLVVVDNNDEDVMVVESFGGDGENSGSTTKIWKIATIKVGSMLAGFHSIKIGGYLSYDSNTQAAMKEEESSSTTTKTGVVRKDKDNWDSHRHQFQIRFDHLALSSSSEKQ